MLFGSGDAVLLTVSGGMDSVTLAHLFHEAKYKFGIAHCNFGLRGEESDADEEFVRKLAGRFKVPFYTTRFETDTFANREKISIQMAARMLRYNWFRELAAAENYSVIATAHHRNDVLETILLNLTRGTGISGMHGIRARSGDVIRPLLFATKEDIYEYVEEKHITWREDSSNSSNKYHRNLLRNEVMPLLKKINPGLDNTIAQTVERVEAAERILEEYIERKRTEAVKKEGKVAYLNIAAVDKDRERKIVLYELLKPYNFNYSDIDNILEAFRAESGKQFASPTHLLVKDREELVITPRQMEEFMGVLVGRQDKRFEAGGNSFAIEEIESRSFVMDNSREVASLDLGKLQFPLELRKWKEGDWFCPLGMNNKKKLSDFLIDSKVPLNLKSDVKVLLSGGKIVWVVGYRLDDRFKVSDLTEKVLKIRRLS